MDCHVMRNGTNSTVMKDEMGVDDESSRMAYSSVRLSVTATAESLIGRRPSVFDSGQAAY